MTSKRISDLTTEIDTIEDTLEHFATCIRQANKWSIACAMALHGARVALAEVRKAGST